MVNRIEIIPLEVRGYGNIIIPKTANDFIGKYNEIYTNSHGDFILSYGGVMLKMAATVQNTIHGLTARLNVIVTTREGNSPVSDLSVECTIDSTVLTPKTTDTDGACYFTWTPAALGDSTILLTIQQQGGYAALTETKEITIGVLLSFNTIMNDLRLEDDEIYIADITQQVQSRTQLTDFVKDVWVAEGGEPIVDPYGIIHLASKGDVVVEQDSLDQLSEYDNVLFEGDVELLTGAVYDMSITEDYELILNCLEREDITGDTPVPPTPSFDGVTLTTDKSILSYADSESATLTAQLLDGSSSASVSGVTVEFFKGSTSLGTATTNSSGVATKTYASTGEGDVSLTVSVDSYTSTAVTIEDCLIYDDATVDKTSNYSTLNANSFTHTTDCYSLKRTLGESATSTYYTPVYLTDFTLPSDYEISVDISTDTISQEMLNIVSSPVQTYQGVNEFGVLSTAVRYGLFKRVSGTGTFYTTNGSLNTNEYYNFKVRVNGTSVTDTITDSNNVQKHTNTQTISQASDFHKFTIVNGGKAHTIKFKNLKVKPL